MKKNVCIAVLVAGITCSATVFAATSADTTSKLASDAEVRCASGKYDAEKRCVRVPVCAEGQYLAYNLKKCYNCPENATCSGGKVYCKKGYVVVATTGGITGCQSSCKNNEYITFEGCKACPDNATCNGETATCDKGFKKEEDRSNNVTCRVPVCPTVACTKNQYRISDECGTCTNCPKNATCNGQTVTCDKGFEKLVNRSTQRVYCQQTVVTCKSSQYLVDGKCVACPKNATCDGKTVTCNKGFEKLVNRSTQRVYCQQTVVTCKSSQYRVDGKCVACPKNATCNGTTAICKKNMVTTTKNGKVTCSVKQCKQGSHINARFIRDHYKNCTKCWSEDIKAGACAKNKKAHKHYYCNCNC